MANPARQSKDCFAAKRRKRKEQSVKPAIKVSSVPCASLRQTDSSAVTGRVCPACGKPFLDDEEVGPVPACECGTRGKEIDEPFGDPAGEPEGDFLPPVRPARSCCRFVFNPRMDTDDHG